jgi:uncharacterized SAM-binding protein YcdF (DUF218 family)
MLYWISKAVWRLVEPDNLLLLIALFGLTSALAGRRRLGFSVLTAALVAMLCIATLPIGAAMLGSLEAQFPEPRVEGPIDGVIVLGGALNPEAYFAHPGSGINSAVARIIEAARLARDYPTARIVYSGGPRPSEAPNANEGEAARDLLVALGVDPARITLDLESRNTYENAREAARLIEPRPGARWLLVTSAFHMPRAVACFRAVGFPVTAIPVDFKYRRRESVGFDFASGLADLDLAAHEWIGLVAYRMLGRTL